MKKKKINKYRHTHIRRHSYIYTCDVHLHTNAVLTATTDTYTNSSKFNIKNAPKNCPLGGQFYNNMRRGCKEGVLLWASSCF